MTSNNGSDNLSSAAPNWMEIFFRQFPQPALLLRQDGVIMELNEEAEKIFNQPAERLRNSKLGIPLQPEEVIQVTLPQTDHTQVKVNIKSREIKFEDQSAYLVIMEPISKLEKSFSNGVLPHFLPSFDTQFRNLADFLPTGITVFFRNRLLYHNLSFTRITGFTRNSLNTLDQLLEQILPQNLQIYRPFNENEWDLTNLPQKFEASVIAPDHQPRWLEINLGKILFQGATADLITFYDVTERKQMQDALTHQALFDDLTGLPNRNHLENHIQAAINVHPDQILRIFSVDLVRFDDVNDTFGHQNGDRLLKQIGQRLRATLPPKSFLSRIGGNNFYIVISNLDEEGFERFLNIINDTFHIPFILEENVLYVDIRIGISSYPEDGNDSGTLIKNADAALSYVKAHPKERIMHFKPQMATMVMDRLRTVNRLRMAIQNNEFVLYYQPKVDLQEMKVIGLEGLIRWKHPELGLIPPKLFILLAEEVGLIHPIWNWVLQEACSQCATWQEAGYPPINVALNVSPSQFPQTDFVENILSAITRNTIPSNFLSIEITENVFMDNAQEEIERLNELQRMGIEIDIDDFGTAYSSLSYLERLPVNTLKIDQVFIQHLGVKSPDKIDHTALVQSIIHLGHSLNLKVLAEGIETEAQLRILQQVGCDLGQGYLFSRPIPANKVWESIQTIQDRKF